MDTLFGYCAAQLRRLYRTATVDVGRPRQKAADNALDPVFWQRCYELEKFLLMSLQGELLKRCQSSSSASRCNELIAAVTILVSFQQFIRSLYPDKVNFSPP